MRERRWLTEGTQAAGTQAQRLEELLEAKREHDEAVARIDECVAQGLLSAEEAAEQRSIAARAWMVAKADSGVAEDGVEREGGAHAAKEEPKRRRGRQAGSKNTPRTGLDDLPDKTLRAVCEDLGLTWAGDRAQATAAIHAQSGSTAKTPKTNLDGLQEGTLALICADRGFDSSGDRAGLIARIQAGVPGKKAGREPREAEQATDKTAAEAKQQAKGAKKAKGKVGAAAAAAGKPQRAATAYNLYLGEEIARIKKADPSLTHKEAFKQAAANWGASKQKPEAAEGERGKDNHLRTHGYRVAMAKERARQLLGEDSETGEPCPLRSLIISELLSDSGSVRSSDQEDNESDDASSSDDAWDSCDIGNKKKAAGIGKQPMARDDGDVFLKEIEELEKRGDVEDLLNGLHRYPSESEVQCQVCQSLMKLLTSKDKALADRYLTIALGGNPDAGDNYSASASGMMSYASTGRALKERLMLSIYEHGENDEELQDAAFGLLHIITDGISRRMFYLFLWCVFASTHEHGIQLAG